MTQRSSICIIAPNSYYLCKDEWKHPFTGVDLQLFNWAKQLQLADFNIDMVVGDFGQPETEEVDAISLYRAAPIGNAGLIQGIRNFVALAQALRKTKAKIWLTRGTGPLPLEVWLLATLTGKHLVAMVASDVDVDHRVVERYGILGKLYHRMLERVSLVVVQNEYQKKQLMDRKKPIVLIPNTLPDRVKKPATFLDRTIDYLWVGSTHSVKRPEVFLELVKQHPQSKCVMILGVHDKKVRNAIAKEVAQYSNCELLEDVPYPETYAYFQKARWYCMTSEFEGFANTLVQAMMSGTPTISTQAVDPLSLYSSKRAGVLLEDFSHAEDRLASEDWAVLSQSTRDTYDAEFSSEKLTRTLIKRLEELHG